MTDSPAARLAGVLGADERARRREESASLQAGPRRGCGFSTVKRGPVTFYTSGQWTKQAAGYGGDGL